MDAQLDGGLGGRARDRSETDAKREPSQHPNDLEPTKAFPKTAFTFSEESKRFLRSVLVVGLWSNSGLIRQGVRDSCLFGWGEEAP
jgi:hypothetical protein